MNRSCLKSFFVVFILLASMSLTHAKAATGYIPKPPKEVESCKWYLDAMNVLHADNKLERFAGKGIVEKLQTILKPGKYSIKALARPGRDGKFDEQQLAPEADAISFEFKKTTWRRKDYLKIIWWKDETALHTHILNDLNAGASRSKTEMSLIANENGKSVKLHYDPLDYSLSGVRFNLAIAIDNNGKPVGFSLEHTDELAQNINMHFAWFSDLEILEGK